MTLRMVGLPSRSTKEPSKPETKKRILSDSEEEQSDDGDRMESDDKTQRSDALPLAEESDSDDDADRSDHKLGKPYTDQSYRDVPSEHKHRLHDHILFLVKNKPSEGFTCNVCGKGGDSL